MKIKEIYALQEIVDVTQDSVKYDRWYNLLLNKTENELTENDVYTMFTQHVLEELAIKKAITFIEVDPLAGVMWEGQSLEHLAEASLAKLLPHKTALKKLSLLVEESVDPSMWDFDFEEKDFMERFEKFKSRVSKL